MSNLYARHFMLQTLKEFKLLFLLPCSIIVDCTMDWCSGQPLRRIRMTGVSCILWLSGCQSWEDTGVSFAHVCNCYMKCCFWLDIPDLHQFRVYVCLHVFMFTPHPSITLYSLRRWLPGLHCVHLFWNSLIKSVNVNMFMISSFQGPLWESTYMCIFHRRPSMCDSS